MDEKNHEAWGWKQEASLTAIRLGYACVAYLVLALRRPRPEQKTIVGGTMLIKRTNSNETDRETAGDRVA